MLFILELEHKSTCHHKLYMIAHYSWDVPHKVWISTPLGRATLASGMDPKQALDVHADLKKAREGLVLSTDLHLTYLVTPLDGDLKIDWDR